MISRLHRLIRRCYPRRVRDRDGDRLRRLLDRLLAEAQGPADRRRIRRRATLDALNTLPRAWLEELERLPGPGALLDGLGADVRFGLRRLRRAPVFTAMGALTLALAIGAVSAVFTVVDAFFLRPLPYEAPDELVVLWETGQGTAEPTTVSPPNFLDWRRELGTIGGMAAFNGTNAVLTATGEATMVPASVVTTDFFDVLGVAPALGPGLGPEHGLATDTLTPAPVVVLSHGLWVRQFGADPSVVGGTVEIDDRAHEVVGVMPEGFRHPRTFLGSTPAQLWMPIGFGPSVERRDVRYLHVFGRRRAGATTEAVRAELQALQARLVELHPEDNAGRGAVVVPIDEQLFGDQRPLLVLLLGAAGLLLLVACVNMANLHLARGLRRERELAVQAALGSGRAGIARQLLVESGLVALLGGALGIGLLFALGGTLAAVVSPYLNPLARIELDLGVVAFTLALTAGAGLVFGLLPALRLSRTDLAGSLGARGTAASGGRARGLLVVAEVALTLVLVFGAGLLGRSLQRLTSLEPGFRVERTVLFQLRPPFSRYATSEQALAFYDRLERRLEAGPDFENVAFMSDIPLTSENRTASFTVPDSEEPELERSVEYHVVSPDYFEAAGVRVLGGRGFTRVDGSEEPVAVVNRAMERWLFGSALALGRVLDFSGFRTRVVGVVESTIDDGLEEAPAPRAYFPHARSGNRTMWAVARTAGPAEGALARVRGLVSDVDATVPVSRLSTMEDHVASSVSGPRGVAGLTSGFGALALLMATLGVYGVLASAVAERTRELGVRAALGAGRSELIRLVLGRSLRLALLGIAAGLALTPLVGALLRSQLYEVGAWDPLAVAGAVAVVGAASLAAAWIPARRAARADPLVAMRAE